MPRVACDLSNSKYFHYKLSYDDNDKVEYFTTKKNMIKEHPELSNRIIYKYTCVDTPEFVPREKRRKNRGYWIDKVKILILRGNTQSIRIPYPVVAH
tara:strand:- start:200 stop:490 length:291 start_codon:yes stop_codon:yes gene_type:complete